MAGLQRLERRPRCGRTHTDCRQLPPKLSHVQVVLGVQLVRVGDRTHPRGRVLGRKVVRRSAVGLPHAPFDGFFTFLDGQQHLVEGRLVLVGDQLSRNAHQFCDNLLREGVTVSTRICQPAPACSLKLLQ